MKMFHVFALFIGASIIRSGCSSELPLHISYDSADFIPYPDFPGALVVREGRNFSLKCEGQSHVNWTFPEYDPEDMEVISTVNISGWLQNEHPTYLWAANLHVIHAHTMDTGYYYCRNDDGTNVASQYVYVRGDTQLITNIPVNDQVTQYQSYVMSCRPTSPDVKVSLRRDDEELVPDSGESYGNMRVSYDSTFGFTLTNMNLINAGMYECHGTRNEDNAILDTPLFTNIHVLAHTDDVPKPSINGTAFIRVVEGTKLVLECTVTTNIDVQFYMNWNIPNNQELGTSRIVVDSPPVLSVIDSNGSKKKLGSKFLTIRNLLKSDTGPYECIITDHTQKSSTTKKLINVTGADEKYLHLKVQGDSVINTTAGTPSVQWVVTMSAHPVPTLEWYTPSGKLIKQDETTWKYLVNTTDLGTVLIIKDLMVSDAGVYQLRARGPMQKTLRFTLAVRVAPSISLVIAPEELFYKVDKTYNITCEVTAYPAPIVKWYFKRCDTPPTCTSSYKQITSDDVSEKIVGTSRMASTYLRVAQLSGYIMCHAENSEGKANQTTTFWVSDINDGFDAQGPKDVVEGDNVTLTCGASKYNYTNSISWFYRPQPVSPLQQLKTNGSDYTLEDQRTAFSYKRLLIFKGIKKARSGVYTCKVVGSNELGDVNKSVSVFVEDLTKPKIVPATDTDGQDLLVGTGDSAKLTCILLEGSHPNPIITWYKDEMVIKVNNTDYELDNGNQTLYIKFSKESLEGEYRCNAWNRAGEDNKYMTLQLKDKRSSPNVGLIVSMVIVAIILLILIVLLGFKYMKEKKLRKELRAIGLDQFEKGAMESINTELPIDDQAELLPYDKKWEFPRDKLKLGKQLGAGAFGVVMKADATGICDDEDVTTVAVKMVKRNADHTYIKALASELKIMVHLGKHLNVVNLLGACTKNLTKRELFVIVEYCRFGNLHNYLLRHRAEFIDQVDPKTGVIDPNLGADIIARHESMANKSSRSDSASSSDYLGATSVSTSGGAITSETVLISMTPTGGEEGCMVSNNSIQPEWRTNYAGDYKGKVRPICTRDLVCWAYQVARGMEYLAGRKVLHGDLAARNILLSDDNVVKICDFGLAKSMYKSDNYKKKGDGPLPVKWMSVESIRDRVFSTQSDVWSFGIVLWEFFSLARTPYPGMEADEKLYNKLVEGYRMDKPEFATQELYEIMDNCWLAKPTERPSFGDLSVQLGNMLEDSIRMHYVDLNDPYMDMNTTKWKESQQSDYLAMMTAPTYDNMVAPGGEGEDSIHQYANGYLVPRPSTSVSDLDNTGYLCMKSPVEKVPAIFSPRSADSPVFNFSPPQRHTPDDLTKPDELKPMLSSNNEYLTPIASSSPVNNLNNEKGKNVQSTSDTQMKANFAPSFSNPSYQTMGAIPSVTTDTYVNMTDQGPVSLGLPKQGSISSLNYLAMGKPVVDNTFNQIHFTNTKDKEGAVNFSNHGHNLSDASSGFQSDSEEHPYVN